MITWHCPLCTRPGGFVVASTSRRVVEQSTKSHLTQSHPQWIYMTRPQRERLLRHGSVPLGEVIA